MGASGSVKRRVYVWVESEVHYVETERGSDAPFWQLSVSSSKKWNARFRDVGSRELVVAFSYLALRDGFMWVLMHNKFGMDMRRAYA